MDTLPILQDSEFEHMVRSLQKYNVDISCSQEINMNLDNYYLRRKLEYISRKRELNYRAVYLEKGHNVKNTKLNGGLLSLYKQKKNLTIIPDQYAR